MQRFSLPWQLFLAFGLVMGVTIPILGLVAGNWLQRAALKTIEESLRDKAALVHEFTRHRTVAELQAHLNLLREELGTRVTLIGHDGLVIAESDRDHLGDLDNHGQRPEVIAARQQTYGIAKRYSTTTRKNMMYVARRVSQEDSPVAFVRVALPISDVEEQVAELSHWVWGTAAVTGAFVLLLAWWLVRRIIEPVQELQRGAAAVAAGSFGHKVYVERKDELGALADAFNQMSQRLAEQFAQLDRDRHQLRAVLGSMVEGVIAVDAERNVLFANERARQLLDFPVPQPVGRKLWELIRHRPVHHLVQQLLADENGQATSLDWTGAGGHALTVHGARLPGAPVRGVVLVFHDISELRRLERVRQEFVANVSHELKTPLSVIVACVETLQNGALDDLENRGKFLDRIAVQSSRLSALIVDLLSLAQIESGAEATANHEVNVEEAVRLCVERHLERAKSKGQRLEMIPPPKQPEGGALAWFDEDALSHILDNLVDNAIKYTPEGGTIQLAWWLEADRCIVEVRDNGIGIAEPELSRVFERFYRVDKARSRELGGTGLGLSIVKHLSQTLGGSVRAASEPGKGSAFAIVLPVRPD
jgi:two-component system phosphate regulon sensor histidine kinase PhoR